MRCSKNTERSAGRRRTSPWIVPLLLALFAAGCATDSDEPPAALVVSGLDLVSGQDSIRLQAALEHRLSDAVRDALHNGVSLTFVWKLELIAQRDLLWDTSVWSAAGSRQVSYRSLSRRYTVTTSDAGIATSYPDVERVFEALSKLDVVLDLTRERLDAVPRPRFRFRTWLDIAALPPPLRLPSYLSAAWRLDSGWHWFQPG